MIIRPAAVGDAEALLDIYAYYVRETAVSFEYDVPTRQAFAQRMERVMERYPYLVLEEGGEPLGYAYAGPFKDRAAYDWAVETTIYLRRDVHHRGYGRALYTALEEALKEKHILNAYACITYAETEDEHLTQASPRFHERMGYRLCGTFRQCGYKFGRWYDMIWMEKTLGGHPTPPLPVSWQESR